ncbi:MULTISPECIES: ABC-type transport auxiliary lipoprotein family protein [unclassified Mesorhizobium]|uniref:ABC-type transport auxiliary lipoprotein family protein n=1 Tax=unclassified Mesorhizobium TaxID=325217 RepID=UPI0003CE500D|nr:MULTISPECIES: ABC-type transport auxiliary lipoprotein family protein [unclassified Mesorhizobium]ESY13923.1 ABC transporter [Mesorhizobium sp. LNJC395A00]WJI76503.1 ABC-type transport auxiliary lipoprotein family protein [Mesorhizobium sp. C395A]
MAGHGVDFRARPQQLHGPRMRIHHTIRGQWGSRVTFGLGGYRSAAVLLGLTLAGCAALGGKPAPLDTFELSAPSIDAHGHSRRQILIAQPSALKALDSQNIVIKPSDRSIQYLKGAQWADRLPLIVQARLAETFQRSGSFAGVGKPGEGLAIDYQVIVEIRSFEVRVNGGEHAEVNLFVRILNDRNGEVRASKSFTASAPVSGSGNPAYVNALDSAFGEAAKDIVGWTDSVI